MIFCVYKFLAFNLESTVIKDNIVLTLEEGEVDYSCNHPPLPENNTCTSKWVIYIQIRYIPSTKTSHEKSKKCSTLRQE